MMSNLNVIVMLFLPTLFFSCLRNVVAMFHVLEKELEWRKSTGRPEGYEAMKRSKPLVAVGPEHALEDENLMADYFRTSRPLVGSLSERREGEGGRGIILSYLPLRMT